MPESLPQSRSKSPAQEPLVVALARTFLIDSDRHSSLTDLARALDVDSSSVGRITRLTLATDIVEAILRGVEPSGFSLAG